MDSGSIIQHDIHKMVVLFLARSFWLMIKESPNGQSTIFQRNFVYPVIEIQTSLCCWLTSDKVAVWFLVSTIPLHCAYMIIDLRLGARNLIFKVIFCRWIWKIRWSKLHCQSHSEHVTCLFIGWLFIFSFKFFMLSLFKDFAFTTISDTFFFLFERTAFSYAYCICFSSLWKNLFATRPFKIHM